jgi:hypothetical protein
LIVGANVSAAVEERVDAASVPVVPIDVAVIDPAEIVPAVVMPVPVVFRTKFELVAGVSVSVPVDETVGHTVRLNPPILTFCVAVFAAQFAF